MLVSFLKARNDELIFLTPELTIQEARSWFPKMPRTTKETQNMFCAGPIACKHARAWLSHFSPTGRPQRRQKALLSVIETLDGCVNGPLGDLRAEAYEELLETVVEGNDISKLEDAAKLYTQRKFFRRAQELLVRASALRRGETRLRAKPLREHGELPLHSSLHLDEANASYVSTLPRAIVNADPKAINRVMDNAPDTGRSTTLANTMKDVSYPPLPPLHTHTHTHAHTHMYIYSSAPFSIFPIPQSSMAASRVNEDTLASLRSEISEQN